MFNRKLKFILKELHSTLSDTQKVMGECFEQYETLTNRIKALEEKVAGLSASVPGTLDWKVSFTFKDAEGTPNIGSCKKIDDIEALYLHVKEHGGSDLVVKFE